VGNKLVSILGWLCIAAGIAVLVYIYAPVVATEIKYQTATQPATIVPVDTELGIVIPKIGANAKIIADVDPFNSWEYQQALTRGVAQAKGTVLPGDPGNSFLFSHSSADLFLATTYNSIFYLINKLEVGDEIIVYRNNNPISFAVTEKKTVSPKDISYLSTTSPEPQITLMTCWPPGTDIKRLMVIAQIKLPQ
jgi:sortase A